MRLLRIGLALWLLACVGVAQAALTFPALTGRVVDSAQMIDPAVREQLTQQLQALEQTSGDQLVVVTCLTCKACPLRTTVINWAASGALARRARTTARC